VQERQANRHKKDTVAPLVFQLKRATQGLDAAANSFTNMQVMQEK